MSAGKLPETIILNQPGAWVRIEIGTHAPGEGPSLGEGEAEPSNDDIIDVEAELLELVPVEDGVKVEGPAKPTPREIDVLRLVARGYTNRQAAEKLCISVRTVESHRANLMGKWHAESRGDLLRSAKERGYL